MEIQNAIIKKIWLEVEDHNCLICDIALQGAGWETIFGGYNLCNSNKLIEGKDYTGFYIRRLIEIFLDGYGKLDSLEGMPCRVKMEGRKVTAIGHFLKDKWFEPRIELSKED